MIFFTIQIIMRTSKNKALLSTILTIFLKHFNFINKKMIIIIQGNRNIDKSNKLKLKKILLIILRLYLQKANKSK
jgi:hypothetical protein